jgi:hypothetical protein
VTPAKGAAASTQVGVVSAVSGAVLAGIFALLA